MEPGNPLLGLSDWSWGWTRSRLEGLTDDELRWEPVPGAWTIRVAVDGTADADGSRLPDEPPPVTTLAWRIWHLTECYGAARNAAWLLGPDHELADADAGRARLVPRAGADAARAALTVAHDWWRVVLEHVSDAALAEPLGPIGGPYADASRAGFVAHMLDELIHHGAELGLLRDLYRDRERTLDPSLAELVAGRRPDDLDRLRAERPDLVRWVVVNGYWQAVDPLLDAGFPVEGSAPGSSALHHAAAAGRLAIVERLVAAGADLERLDGRFHATPLGWAEFFGQDDVAAFLRPRPPG